MSFYIDNSTWALLGRCHIIVRHFSLAADALSDTDTPQASFQRKPDCMPSPKLLTSSQLLGILVR